jgi:tetratricopeptide (TPR) repeat protein
MRIVLTAFLVPLAALVPGVTAVRAADTFSGSGVVIGTQGEILTNSHVVENCESITVQFSDGNSESAVLAARDQKNDLAVIRMNTPPASIAIFREGAPIRAGDAVVALGYPLSGLLASTTNVSVGNVSALAGLGDDSRYFQISAPVHPGNSGGPLLDLSGHVIGIVRSKLDAIRVARFTGDLPQNVNFAIKSDLARAFLESRGISYRTARSDQQLSPADVGDIARPFTVHIECKQAALRSAAAPTTSLPTPPSAINPTSQQLSWCQGKDNPSPDQMINGCTTVIQSGRWTGKNLSIAFNDRGAAYRAKGDYDRAIADYDQAIKLDPTNANVFYNRAIAYGAKAEHDRAIADYDQVIKLDPKNADAFNNRANCYRLKADYNRAIADYDQAIKLDPRNVLAYTRRGLSYAANGDYDHAFTNYERALKLDPKYAAAYGSRGAAYAANGDYARAFANYEQAIKLDPKNVAIYTSRGEAYRAQGDNDRAIQDYNEAMRLDPKYALAFNNRGLAYRAKAAYDRAITDLTEAIRLDSKYVDAYNNRGLAYFQKRDFPMAAADFLRSIELKDTAYPMLWRYLARGRAGESGPAELAANAARLKTKDWPYPIIEFYLGQRSAADMPATTPEERCLVNFYLGEWHMLHGNRAEASAALRTAADTCPKIFSEYDSAVVELKRLNQ